MAINELEQQIIKLYENGLSMAKVGIEVGKSAATVLRVLRKYNIKTRTKGGINQLPTQEILYKYLEEKRSLENIGKDYEVTANTIKKVILNSGEKIRTSSETRNPYFREDYFKNIDNEAAAYYLGFLITDGCISEPDIKNKHPNYKIKLELQEQDGYILEKFKRELCLTSANLYHSVRIKGNNIVKSSSLGFYSTKMANDLAKYGVMPRKTDKVYLPKLSMNLMPHLIRGMIDGDGSITITHVNGKPRLVVYFCGNEQCVTQLRDFLVEQLKIYSVKIIHSEKNLYQISWAGKQDVLKICDYLYHNAHYYLIRKFNKYKLALNNFENTEIT